MATRTSLPSASLLCFDFVAAVNVYVGYLEVERLILGKGIVGLCGCNPLGPLVVAISHHK